MATFEVNTLVDEADYGATITIPNPFGPDTIVAIGPNTSLREAIKLANDNPGEDTITFAPNGQGLIRLTQGEIDITDELTIQGGSAVTMDGYDMDTLSDDAAALIDPLTGEGIGNAIRSGRIAAEHIISAFNKTVFDAHFNKQYDKVIYQKMGKEWVK